MQHHPLLVRPPRRTHQPKPIPQRPHPFRQLFGPVPEFGFDVDARLDVGGGFVGGVPGQLFVDGYVGCLDLKDERAG